MSSGVKHEGHSYNPSSHKAEAGGSQVRVQPELHSEILSLQTSFKEKNHETVGLGGIPGFWSAFA